MSSHRKSPWTHLFTLRNGAGTLSAQPNVRLEPSTLQQTMSLCGCCKTMVIAHSLRQMGAPEFESMSRHSCDLTIRICVPSRGHFSLTCAETHMDSRHHQRHERTQIPLTRTGTHCMAHAVGIRPGEALPALRATSLFRVTVP